MSAVTTARLPVSPSARLLDAGMLMVCAVWGVNFSMMKFALQTFEPFALAGVRFTVASAVLWLVARRLEPDVRVPVRTAWALLGLGVIGNTLYQVGFMLGLSETTAGNSSLLIASTPLMTAMVGLGLGVEQITRPVAVAIAIGTVGVALVVLGHGGEVGFSFSTLTGDLLTLFAVLCWAFFSHGVRKVGADVSPLQVATLTTIGGAPGLLLAGWRDLAEQDWAAVSGATWGAVAYSTLLSIVLCYVIWNKSVSLLGANRTSLYSISTPLFAMSAAALMLGERPTGIQLVGALLILASVAVTMLANWRTGGDPTCEEGV